MLTILLPFVIICIFRGVFWGDVRTDGGIFHALACWGDDSFNKVLYQASALIMVWATYPACCRSSGSATPNMTLPHTYYFELKTLEEQQMLEEFPDSPLYTYNRPQNFPWERCLLFTRKSRTSPSPETRACFSTLDPFCHRIRVGFVRVKVVYALRQNNKVLLSEHTIHVALSERLPVDLVHGAKQSPLGMSPCNEKGLLS